MRLSNKNVLFLFFLLNILLSSCQSESGSEGPYLGNGFLNGYADQTSIVLWTRLTQTSEGNLTGEKFLIPSAEEHRELSRELDPQVIWNAQIPVGFSLDEMDGACMGASGEVKLTYYPLTALEDKVITEWVAVDPGKNYTHQWRLEGLKSGTKYVVEIEARKEGDATVSDRITGGFRTPPSPETVEETSFCIVTCHDYWRRDTTAGHKIYESMLGLFPDFYVHTGDIEYYDKQEPYALTEALMRFKWGRLMALPLQRTFWGQVTSYFMRDDHDVLVDDAFPDKTYGTVTWERGLEIFDEQVPVSDPPYKTIRWSKDLQIWLTEGRVYRSKNSDPDGPSKTIFGQQQKEWLFRTLEESDATYKVIINANAILGPDRDRKNDSYANAGFTYEGDEIRNFLNRFDNVYLCNGDRHWQYVTHWEGTNLWEFGSGAGADIHAGGWSQADVRPEHRFLRVKGGFLYGKTERKDHQVTLTFQHCDVNGNVVHEESFVRDAI